MQNNIMEIRMDALKLLSMFKRPVPQDAVTIGAWINIFQVMENTLYESGHFSTCIFILNT